ncbi:MAG: type II secretion system F family protein [Planctomycetota bacterium]
MIELAVILGFVFQPWSTSAQRLVFLRTLLKCVRYNLPAARMIQALGEDESGWHGHRVRRVARHLAAGATLPVALGRVPGVLSIRQETQIQFGLEMGDVESALESAIHATDVSEDSFFSNNMPPYVFFCLLIMASIVTFIARKIFPTMMQIHADFSVEPAPPLVLWGTIVDGISRFGFVLPLLFCTLIVAKFANFSRIVQKGALSRFAAIFFDWDAPDFLQQMSLALSRNRQPIEAIGALARCHHSPWRRTKLREIEVDQSEKDIWEKIHQRRLITSNELEVVRASEKLQNTPWALGELSECRLSRLTNRFGLVTRPIIPAIIVVMGLFVALSAISMLSLILQLVHSLA